MPSSLERLPALGGFLGGDDTSWAALGISAEDLLALAEAEELSVLLYDRLLRSRYGDQWPAAVRDALSAEARAATAAELLRAAETRAVLDALAAAGVRAILLKGTPLAYSVYDNPGSRPRQDTDMLVRTEDVEAARRVMASRGYATTVHCNDLFSQFEVQKQDRYGVAHVFDVHWKVSAQPVFAAVFTYDEVLDGARPITALGPNAIGLGAVDALLLACIHPVMHHHNEERALWIYDIHLLAAQLSVAEFDTFADLALQKQIAAVSARGLRLAQKVFSTPVPAAVWSRLLAAGSEPSAKYLDAGRRWHDELVSSVRGLPALSDRLKLLREVLFPSPSYMLGAYGLRGKPLGSLLLPALYLHRNAHGALKVLAGKK